MAKILIISGILLLVAGVVVYFSDRFPSVGKLPGDIKIEKKNFTFYFPLGTSILISLLLTLIFWLIRRF